MDYFYKDLGSIMKQQDFEDAGGDHDIGEGSSSDLDFGKFLHDNFSLRLVSFYICVYTFQFHICIKCLSTNKGNTQDKTIVFFTARVN